MVVDQLLLHTWVEVIAVQMNRRVHLQIVSIVQRLLNFSLVLDRALIQQTSQRLETLDVRKMVTTKVVHQLQTSYHHY